MSPLKRDLQMFLFFQFPDKVICESPDSCKQINYRTIVILNEGFPYDRLSSARLLVSHYLCYWWLKEMLCVKYKYVLSS